MPSTTFCVFLHWIASNLEKAGGFAGGEITLQTPHAPVAWLHLVSLSRTGNLLTSHHLSEPTRP